MQFTVPSNISLKEFLKEKFPDSSNNTIQSWIKGGRISVDGCAITTLDTPLKEGQTVLFSKKEMLLPYEIKVLYEDKDIVVIYKPEGLLSVATDKEGYRTAHSVLKRRFHSQMVYPVHRLDRDTSGVMLFAYTKDAQEKLRTVFEKKDIVREYVAVVHGIPDPLKGTIRSNLIEHNNLHVTSSKNPLQGKPAVTHYEVLGGCSKFSLVKFQLETGRKNQIRVHMAEMAHPIAGDEKYGSSSKGRLCLHAYHLNFKHPITGKDLSFSSPIPPLFFKLTKVTPDSIYSKLKLTN